MRIAKTESTLCIDGFILHHFYKNQLLNSQGGIMALKRRPPENNVRRVKTNSKNSFGVTTNQNCETTQFESDKEWILQKYFLRDRRVSNFVSQPLIIHYIDEEGISRTYTPDLKVFYRNGVIKIVEFSMFAKRQEPSIRRRENAAREFCRRMGWDYVVFTEHDLPSATEIDNLRTLIGYMPEAYFQKEICSAILDVLAGGNEFRILELSSTVSEMLGIPQSIVHNTLFHMFWYVWFSYTPNQLIFIDGTPNRKVKIWINTGD
jgi:hypothetical protein